MTNQERKTQVEVQPQYDKVEYWLVLPTAIGYGAEPKILKTPPRTQTGNELVVRLDLQVPKTLRRTPQVIEIKLPEEIGQIARIEVTAKDIDEPK